MAKKDQVQDQLSIDIEAPEVVPTVLIRPTGKTYSFEQWAQLRKKPERHLNGMRAFLQDQAGNRYPLEVWDEKMKAY